MNFCLRKTSKDKLEIPIFNLIFNCFGRTKKELLMFSNDMNWKSAISWSWLSLRGFFYFQQLYIVCIMNGVKSNIMFVLKKTEESRRNRKTEYQSFLVIPAIISIESSV